MRARKRSQLGQTAVIVALCFVVLVAFAGLAVDGGHVFLVNRQAQNATDAAALAAAKQLASSGGFLSGPPSTESDPSVKAAHDLAFANGFVTAFPGGCSNYNGTSFTTSWVDVGGCGSTTFATRVTVNSPPRGPMSKACQAAPYNCLQVVITQKIDNFLMGILGIPVTYSTTSATAYAQPPQNVYNVPPPAALDLYEPPSGFNAAAAPTRQHLSCAGGNCPTFWSRPGTRPVIAGVDGKLINAGDQVAMESNGDVVLQDATTFCDPYNGATCGSGSAVGAKGFSVDPGGALYCSGFGAGSPGTYLTCQAGTQTGLAGVYGNETNFAPRGWTPTWNFTGPDCGALVLNGGPVRPSNSACDPPASEPYTIIPGRYTSIVINHGKYEFAQGMFDITSTAVPSTISHGLETAADFDLCGGSCATLTAGVWIGHGNNPYTAGSTGSGNSCSGNSVQGGGGDQTIVSGSGVTFRFEAGSAGFVSTHEVSNITLASGALQGTQGVPILFDMENAGFIHLDSATGSGSPSRFTGIIYQSPNYAGGGVEVNPGLGGSSMAISGQVLAYSFTTFGTAGRAVDFTKGFGASSPIIATGNQENGIQTGMTLQPGPTSSTEQLVVQYQDEWALNGYDSYVRINNGAPQFFSAGMWQVVVGPNDPVPPNPNGNGVSDATSQSARPAAGQPGATNYTQATTSTGLPDWTYKWSDGSSFETSGNWTWGHESNIAGAQSNWNNNGGNLATLTYTFNTPPGSSVAVEIYMDDGDHCGDYTVVDATYANIGQPAGGSQVAGSIRLEQ